MKKGDVLSIYIHQASYLVAFFLYPEFSISVVNGNGDGLD